MTSIYGPRTSPYGKNEALEQLAKGLADGSVPANLKTAKQAIALVEEDGRITTEESQALDKVWDAALKAKPGVSGTTEYGRDLLLNFSKIARNRLFATQANMSSSPAGRMMSMWSWGMIDVRPSSVDIDRSPLTGKTAPTPGEEAIKTTLNDKAGKWDLIRLVEANYPAAISDPGNTYRAPALQADVEQAYQTLRADISAGKVDEKDPLSPMKKFLAANYGQ